MINKWQGLLRSSQTEVQIMLAVLFSENKGKFWCIDCHHLLICFLYIDLQPNSAAPRVQHSGPSNRGVLWKTKVLHNFLHYFHLFSCIHVLFASSCASDSAPQFYFFLGGGGGGGRGERGVGGRRTRWIMRDDAQMANEVRSTNRRQSSNILQRNILQQPTNSWKLRRDKAPNLDPLSVTFAVIRSLGFQNWSIQWGEVGRWEWMFMASSFFHESRWFSSLQAGSLVRAMYDHSFPVLGARPPQIFSGLPQLALSMLAQSMEWPASLSCSDSTDSRSQACTDLLFRCSFCA